MDPRVSEQHVMLRDQAQRYAKEHLAPLIPKAEAEDVPMTEVWRSAGEYGLLGLGVPEEDGGAGADMLSMAIVTEELCRVSVALANGPVMQGYIILPFVVKLMTPEQKARILPGLLSGEKIAALSVTEPGGGSDVARTRTSATPDGDEYVVNGNKIFTTNGSVADWILVAAVTDKSLEHRGMSQIWVEKDRPGFEVGRRLETVGWRGGDTAELFFTDCRVPRSNLLGQENKGFYQIMEMFNKSRITVASMSLGAAQGAYDLALSYAKEREVFGSVIGKHQAIMFKLADMATEIEAARHLTYQAAWVMDSSGKPDPKLGAMAKLYASEVAVKVTNEAMQIFGGYGFSMEYPIQRFWRDARVMTVIEGTSEIQRRIIGKQLGL